MTLNSISDGGELGRGLPSPEFEIIPNFVCLTIRFKKPLKPHLFNESENLSGPINGPISGPINGVVLEVLRLIQSNPGIKKIAIAQQIRRSETTVKRYVKILTDAKLIEYKDSNKTDGNSLLHCFSCLKVCVFNDYSYLRSNRIRHASHLNSEPGRVFCFLWAH